MNKVTLAFNAWQAWRIARREEGSSLRGIIMGIASILAIVGITCLRGDLSIEDVGIIAAGISGLDATLKYIVPDKLSRSNGKASALPSITLVGQSESVPDPTAGPVADELHSVAHPMPPSSGPVPWPGPGGNPPPGWNG